jgi:hypothetical protein
MTEEDRKNPLWLILVETVKSLPLYSVHKAYTRDLLLLENPKITAEEISRRLDTTLGEALVLISEIKNEENS